METRKFRIYEKLTKDHSRSHNGGDYDHYYDVVVEEGQMKKYEGSSSDFYCCPVCGNLDTVPYPEDCWDYPDSRCEICQRYDSGLSPIEEVVAFTAAAARDLFTAKER